jgi:hypothetical protein
MAGVEVVGGNGNGYREGRLMNILIVGGTRYKCGGECAGCLYGLRRGLYGVVIGQRRYFYRLSRGLFFAVAFFACNLVVKLLLWCRTTRRTQ